MHLNQTKTFTKDEFLILAKRGLQLKLGNKTFLYDHTYSRPARYRHNEIQGYVVKTEDGYAEHIQGFWNRFRPETEFKITQLPNTRLLKSRALH